MEDAGTDTRPGLRQVLYDHFFGLSKEILGLPARLETELGNVRTEDNILYIEAAIILEGPQ